MFSLGELFPSSDCAGKFLNYLPAVTQINVVSNVGTVQSKIGELLNASTEKFWVDAQKAAENVSQGSLYSYEGESPYTFHLPPTGNRQGNCLTYSSDDNGVLITMVSQKFGFLVKSFYL